MARFQRNSHLVAFAVLVSLLNTIASQERALPNNKVCLIVPPDVEECYLKFHGKPIDNKAAQVNCLQKLLWNFRPETNLTQSEQSYFRSLVKDATASGDSPDGAGLVTGIGLPPSGSRTRKEYRLMSDQEKQHFHAALNKLYEEGMVSAFARLYAEGSKHHLNGASYLAWNRVFLALFEEALRRHDNTVFLPFWDSTIDNDMDNPVNSVLWTEDNFGAGVGDVIDGPAAGWVTNQGNLERRYGLQSRLLSKESIRNILTRCHLKAISQPFSTRHFDFEYFSRGPLRWVGGDVEAPSTAGYDPVFYLHQAFVDYVWELFRRRQFRRCGVDPALDYPDVPQGDSHHGDAPMWGFDWLTNRDGIKHDWMDNWYDYDSTPSCPNCCDGCRFPHSVYCDQRRRVCVASSRRTFAFGPRETAATNIQDLFSKAQMDIQEIETLEFPMSPRNRGSKYQAPPNDGRTLHTAIADAFEAARIQSAAENREREQTIERQSDRRESHREVVGRQQSFGDHRGNRRVTSIDVRGAQTPRRGHFGGGSLPPLPTKIMASMRAQARHDPRGSSLGSRPPQRPDQRSAMDRRHVTFLPRRPMVVTRTGPSMDPRDIRPAPRIHSPFSDPMDRPPFRPLSGLDGRRRMLGLV